MTVTPIMSEQSLEEKFELKRTLAREFRHTFSPEARLWMDDLQDTFDDVKRHAPDGTLLITSQILYTQAVDHAFKIAAMPAGTERDAMKLAEQYFGAVVTERHLQVQGRLPSWTRHELEKLYAVTRAIDRAQYIAGSDIGEDTRSTVQQNIVKKLQTPLAVAKQNYVKAVRHAERIAARNAPAATDPRP